MISYLYDKYGISNKEKIDDVLFDEKQELIFWNKFLLENSAIVDFSNNLKICKFLKSNNVSKIKKEFIVKLVREITFNNERLLYQSIRILINTPDELVLDTYLSLANETLIKMGISLVAAKIVSSAACCEAAGAAYQIIKYPNNLANNLSLPLAKVVAACPIRVVVAILCDYIYTTDVDAYFYSNVCMIAACKDYIRATSIRNICENEFCKTYPFIQDCVATLNAIEDKEIFELCYNLIMDENILYSPNIFIYLERVAYSGSEELALRYYDIICNPTTSEAEKLEAIDKIYKEIKEDNEPIRKLKMGEN